MDFELLRGSGRRVLKTRKFQGIGGGGGVIINPLKRKFRGGGGGGVKIKKKHPWGVWIFSGTAHLVVHLQIFQSDN